MDPAPVVHRPTSADRGGERATETLILKRKEEEEEEEEENRGKKEVPN
jgi:hypothetical protein